MIWPTVLLAGEWSPGANEGRMPRNYPGRCGNEGKGLYLSVAMMECTQILLGPFKYVNVNLSKILAPNIVVGLKRPAQTHSSQYATRLKGTS